MVKAWSGRSFLAGVVTVLAGLLLLTGATWLMCGGGNDYSIDRELPSPGGTRRAILYTGMGGGAAGWCNQQISIVPVGASFDPSRDNDTYSYVFSVTCDSNVVNLEWAAEDRLRVSYSIGDGVTATLRPHNKDKSVALEYSAVR
jgi:hypothetical protein